MTPDKVQWELAELRWFKEPCGLVVDAPPPTLARREEPKPLAIRTPASRPPDRSEPRRYPSYPLLEWQPRFRWKDLLPWAALTLFMGGIFFEVERLERQAIDRLGECSARVASQP
jgi:hypothetical protein